MLNNLHSRGITEEYIESQIEIINSFNQSVWTPYVENVVNRTITTPFLGVFSLPRTEVCTNTINSVADNFVTAARLANRTVFANVELINTSLQQARNNAREYSRIGVNAAKNFHEATNEVAKIGFSLQWSQQQHQHKEDNNNKEKLNPFFLVLFYNHLMSTRFTYLCNQT